MKHIKYLLILTFLLCACLPAKATYPKGSVLCGKDPDCLEGQYCGFVSGYTAAVCKGQATGNSFNLY